MVDALGKQHYRVAGRFTESDTTIVTKAFQDAQLPVNAKGIYTFQAITDRRGNDEKCNIFVILRRDGQALTNKEKTLLYYYIHGVLVGVALCAADV